MNFRLDSSSILLSLLIIVTGLGLAQAARANPLVAQIENQVRQDLEQHVAAQAATHGRRMEFEISRLDPRLNLPLCSQAPATEFDRSTTQPRISVKVICNGNQPWSMYVPVRLQIWQQVVTARQSINRGQRITANDVILAEVDLASQRYGFLTSLEEAIGAQAKRNINAGDTLTPNLMEAPEVIRKGDEVMITARGSAMSIQVPGTALSHGKVGEQISVRNVSSQKVIRATVVQEGVVEVQI